MKTFYIRRNQHKADPFIDALSSAGWTYKRFLDWPEVYLYDVESADFGYGWHERMYILHEKGKRIFFYPHTARAGYPYTVREPWPYCEGRFAISEGTKEIWRRCGVEGPIHVIGWPWSPIKPFRSGTGKKKVKVLFAPMHPNHNGFLSDHDMRINRETHEVLADLASLNQISLTVRHLQPVERNGFTKREEAYYIAGEPDGNYRDIEEADLIIGSYTFAYMAIALGRPTIMIGEEAGHFSGAHQDMIRHSDHTRHLYYDYARYPFNFEEVVLDREAALSMIIDALFKWDAVENWKKLFIGEGFKPDVFVGAINPGYEPGEIHTGIIVQDKHGNEMNRLPGSIVAPHFVPDKKE
jgi:hypothetical protein